MIFSGSNPSVGWRNSKRRDIPTRGTKSLWRQGGCGLGWIGLDWAGLLGCFSPSCSSMCPGEVSEDLWYCPLVIKHSFGNPLFSRGNYLNMVIFQSYASLLEGIWCIYFTRVTGVVLFVHKDKYMCIDMCINTHLRGHMWYYHLLSQFSHMMYSASYLWWLCSKGPTKLAILTHPKKSYLFIQ